MFELMSALLLVASGNPSTASTGPLTKLLNKCDPEGHISCDSSFFKPVWRKVVSSNGEITKIDMAAIEPLRGGYVDVSIYTFVPGTMFDFNQLHNVRFDCRGSAMFEGEGGGSVGVPPRSVLGEVARIVCPIGQAKAAAFYRSQR